MNKQALQERADSLQSELDQLKALIDKPVGPWVPENGQCYWSCMHEGRVREHQNHYQEFTDSQLAVGDCFRTEEQARAALDRQKLKTEIINTIAELNDGWVPDWSDGDQCKYRIRPIYEHSQGCYRSFDAYDMASQNKACNLYLKSMTALRQLQEKYTQEQLTAAYWG